MLMKGLYSYRLEGEQILYLHLVLISLSLPVIEGLEKITEKIFFMQWK